MSLMVWEMNESRWGACVRHAAHVEGPFDMKEKKVMGGKSGGRKKQRSEE